MSRDSTRVDRYTAAMLDYNGIESYRVETFDSSKPVFLVQVKHFDLAAIVAEMEDEHCTVYLPALLRSFQKIDALIEKSRVSGVWSRKSLADPQK